MCNPLNLHMPLTPNLMQRGKLTLRVGLVPYGKGLFLHILLLAVLLWCSFSKKKKNERKTKTTKKDSQKQKFNSVQVYNLQNLVAKTSFQVKRKKMKLAIVLILLKCFL